MMNITDPVEFELILKDMADCLRHPSTANFELYHANHDGTFIDLWSSMQDDEEVARVTIAKLVQSGSTPLAQALKTLGRSLLSLEDSLPEIERAFITFVHGIATQAIERAKKGSRTH